MGGGEAQLRLPLFSVSLSGYLDTVGEFKAAGSKASPSPLWVTEACFRAGIGPDNLLLGWPPGLGSRPLYRKDFHSESKAGLSDLNRASHVGHVVAEQRCLQLAPVTPELLTRERGCGRDRE